MPHVYTEEQKDFIKENISGRKTNELTEMFNAHFGLNHRVTQIRGFVKNHDLKSGLNTQFVKGQPSHNKGKKGINYEGMKATQFRKGNLPHNYLPVGTERVNGDGYVDIKVADPNKWRGKHILIWEEHNGPVPKDHVIIFGDRNNRNFDINNLILLTRRQLLSMNHNNLIQEDAELTKVGVNVVNIYHKIKDLGKKTNSCGI